MLPLLFFKRLSDVYEEEYQALLERFKDEGIAKRKFHRFTIPEGCLWGDIRVVAQNVGQRLNDALAQIASGDCRLKAACQAERAEEQNRRVIDGRTSSEMDHKNTFFGTPMFAIIISPFWLAISVLYFGLGVFHCRLSKWGSNAPIVPGKDELFSGRLAIFLESEFMRTAHLTKIVLKFAAFGFFIASIISFFQSITVDRWPIPVDDLFFVITLAAFFVVLFLVWRFVICIDSRTREKTIQITLPWIWYDENRGNTFDRVIKPSRHFEAKVGGESVLLAAACFKVRPYIKKFPVDPKEGITLKEKVSGELTVSEKSMVEDKRGHAITATLSDAGLKLLERAYQSRLNDITLAELFEDRATHDRLWWKLSNLKLISFEKSSKKFSFEARAKLLFPDTSTQPKPSFGLGVEKENAS